MEEADVVIAERENVASETTVYFLGAAIILQVLVIGKNINDKLGSKEEVAPMFEGADDGKELPVPDRVVSLGFGKGGGIVSHRVTKTIGVALVEDGARGKLRGVHLEFEGFVMIRLS